jgi:hypothetical protein
LWTLLALINANGHIRIGEMKRFRKAALTGGIRWKSETHGLAKLFLDDLANVVLLLEHFVERHLWELRALVPCENWDSTLIVTRAKLATHGRASPVGARKDRDVASREQRSNKEKKKPKQDKSKKTASASPFAAPPPKGKPTPPQQGSKK